MTIPAAAKATPLPRIHVVTPFVDDNCMLTRHGTEVMTAHREHIVGMNRITPCSASGVNVITLTPNDSAPIIEKYVDYEFFPFVASDNSTAAVTMTVVPRTGTLATLKAYKTNGSAQAGNGDITAGLLYIAVYVDSLDSGAGGFVLK